MTVKRINSTSNRYKAKIKASVEKKNINITVFFFGYALILFQEALERKGFPLEKSKSCDLLNSLYELQKLSVKKRQLVAPYLEMSSTISNWINNEQNDTKYIHTSQEKLQSKLSDPLSHEEWKRFYAIYKEMTEYYKDKANVHISTPNIVQASNENLPKPWLLQVQESSVDLPKPWLPTNRNEPINKKKR